MLYLLSLIPLCYLMPYIIIWFFFISNNAIAYCSTHVVFHASEMGYDHLSLSA